jgi:hypothetical protein
LFCGGACGAAAGGGHRHLRHHDSQVSAAVSAVFVDMCVWVGVLGGGVRFAGVCASWESAASGGGMFAA